MQRRHHALLLLIASSGVLPAISSAQADEALEPLPPLPAAVACAPSREAHKHVLSGHAFLQSFALPSPFADSTATLAMGFGTADTPDPTDATARDLNLGVFTPRVSGSVAIFGPLAINFGVSANMIVGLNSRSILRHGASTATNWKLGVIYEVLRDESNVLSLTFNTENPHQVAVSPIDAAEAFIKDLLGRGNPDYISDTVSHSWAPGVRYARALSSVFGLQALMSVRFNTTRTGEEVSRNKERFSLALGFDADLKPAIGVPVGFTANYLRGQALTAEQANSDTFALGIYETISPAVNFGAEVGTIQTGGNTTSIVALSARAYFD